MKRWLMIFVLFLVMAFISTSALGLEVIKPTKNHKGQVGTSSRIWEYGYFDYLLGDGSTGSVGNSSYYWPAGYFTTGYIKTLAGDGTGTSYGHKRAVTTATSPTTLTAAQSGKIFSNYGDTSGTLVWTLPAAAAGLEYTFVVEALVSTKIDVNTAAGDQIMNITNTAGDYIWADAIGETITLVATGPSYWHVKSYYGTWTEE
jgi:hypothetical protein